MNFSGLYRAFKLAAFASLSMCAFNATAIDFENFEYDVYVGDQNGDGIDDIYLSAKDSFIPIHGEVLVPLSIQLADNYVLQGGDGFYYDPFVVEDIDLTNFTLAPNTVVYDYNEDGFLDLVIGESQNIVTNIALLGSPNTSVPILVANIDKYDVLSTPPKPGTLGLAERQVAYDSKDTGVVLKESDSLAPIVGEFRVSESGAATYSIPLYTPPGSGGVQPQLSFNYSSQSGNGLLGLGWSLGGLSSISRCRQTMATDGNAAPITWSEQDRFCLDGQRLLLESGQKYGEIGATYRTEIDNFSIVTSVGGTLGDPDYFVMKSKDGSISEFGRTDNSSFDNLESKTVSWSVNKFSDSVGNKIDFTYTTTSNTHKISRIDYGSYSTNHSAIIFQYEPRPQDLLSTYTAGFKVETNDRLSGVQVRSDSTVLRQYSVNYDHVNTELSRVVKIEECSNESSTANCRGATTIDWNYPLTGLSTTRTKLFSLDTTSFSDFKQLDINGDGLLDLAYVRFSGGFRDYIFGYAINDGTKLVPISEVPFYNNAFHGALVKIESVDYNADGRSDILLYDGEFEDSSPWSLYLSEPYGANEWRLNKKTSTQIPFTEEMVMFGDINSDGLVDAYYVNKESRELDVYTLVHDVTQSVSSPQYYHFAHHASLNIESFDLGTNFPAPDERRDEYADPVHRGSVFLNGGIGDFNSDGKVDFIVALSESTTYYEPDGEFGISYSTFGTWKLAIATMGISNTLEILDIFKDIDQGTFNKLALREENYFRITDFNQDGYSDLLYLRSNADDKGTWEAYLNNGQNLTYLEDLVIFDGQMVDKSVQLVDINNDGFSDFIWKDLEATRLRVKHWLPEQETFSTQRDIPRFNQNLTSIDYVYSEFNNQKYTDVVSPSVNYFITTNDERDSYSFGAFDSVGGFDVLHFDASENTLYIIPNRQLKTPSHVVGKITNGLGSETIINYSPINETDHYTSLDANISSSTSTKEICVNSESGGYFDDVCYTQTVVTQNLDDFYTRLNEPYNTQLSLVGAEKSAPILEQNLGTYVVTSVSSSSPFKDNQNALATVDYYYANARIQAAGRGFLGFEKLTTLDMQTGIETVTTYRQDYPFVGSPIKTETKYSGNLVSESTSIWSAYSESKIDGILYQPYNAKTTDRSFRVVSDSFSKLSVSQQIVSQVETTNTYDHYGNPTQIVVTTIGDGNTYRVTTDNTYGSSLEELRWGRLSSSNVTHERNGSKIIRNSTFGYIGFDSTCSGASNLRGLLCRETVNPNSSSYALTTMYEYDQYGNQIQSTVSGNGESRVSSSVYASYGRYMDRAVNHYGQTSQDIISWNAYGNPLEREDILGTSTVYKYTDLGETYLEYVESGGYSVTYRRYPSGSCPLGSSYQTDVIAPDNARAFECFDKLGRSLLKASQLLNGDWTLSQTEYDILGRVARQSEPYKNGDTIHWTTYSYDVFSNPIRMDQPDFANDYRISYVTYDGLSKTDINVLGQSRTETKNPLGELVQIRDNINTTVSYEYNAVGDLRVAKTSAGSITHTVEMQFDSYGHKTSMADPDKGNWTYSYNAFNEIIRQVNGNGDIRTLEYDSLGRQIRRVEPDGTSQWVYNNTSAGNSRGQMDYEVLFDGSGNIPYQMNYTYDGFGRVSEMKTTIDDEEFSERTTYDAYGRNFQSFDAASVQNAMQYQYKNGYMYKVVNAANTNEVYYQANVMDARGNVTQYLQGAVTTNRAYDAATGFLTSVGSTVAGVFGTQDLSYSWDGLANLKSRTEKSGDKNLFEEFEFDSINRLISSKIGNTTQSYQYDAFGNTTSKTGVGNYEYGGACINGAGPHAVCEINNGGTTETFDYDNNGNMLTHRVNGEVDRQFVYSSFDKPTRITKGDHSTEFEYGANRSRYKRVDTSSGEATTTLYVGSVEILNKPDGSREVRRYINGTVLVTQDYNVDGNGNYQFARAVTRNILTDHLGSTDVITDVNGQIVQEQSFDAWGARRVTTDGVRLDDISLVSLADVNNEYTTKGFTGHEAVDQVGVIHMNGRIYDARLGRFLQADPQIDGTTHTQGYNRYAYGKNNPLNGTDPSGFGFADEFKKVAGLVVGAILVAVTGGITGPLIQTYWGAAVLGATTSAVSAAVNGGNILQAAVFGAVSGVAFHGVGRAFDPNASGVFSSLKGSAKFFAQSGAHGAVGGVLSVLQGGKFGHGFASSGISKAITFGGNAIGTGGEIQFITAAIAGGTVSEITGGKFANGAGTSALAYLVNQAATDGRQKNTDNNAQEGQAALDLISEHKDTIIEAARAMGVDPQHVASIIFQEKYHGVWANLKNGPAWAMIAAGANDASVGLAEMDINTAARLLGVDAATMSGGTRNQIIGLLANDQSAISLIALNVASFQTALGRPVTLQEATYGHNAGVAALVRDLPIVQGSPVSRRSWGHQGAISDALR